MNKALSLVGGEAAVHDTKFDYYGRFLGTAASDGTIKVFEILPEKSQKKIWGHKAHDGPVWQLSWSHPKFGPYLASCGYDCKVIIWKRGVNNQFTQIYVYNDHTSSVNAVEFQPMDELILLVGASDGISLHSYNQSQGGFQCSAKFAAHHGGVNCVSWSLQRKLVVERSNDSTNRVLRFASGGCDNQVIVWRRTTEGHWEQENELQEDGHQDWVRGVAWAPAAPVIASAGDQTVKIWKEMNGVWTVQQTLAFESQVWSVSFSQAGNTLAVADTTKVTLYKESASGLFQQA